MNFVAIDVETANPDMASICQVGLAKYVDGQLVEEGWVSSRFARVDQITIDEPSQFHDSLA